MHVYFSFVSFKGKRWIFSIYEPIKEKLFSHQFKKTWFYKTINRPSGSDVWVPLTGVVACPSQSIADQARTPSLTSALLPFVSHFPQDGLENTLVLVCWTPLPCSDPVRGREASLLCSC